MGETATSNFECMTSSYLSVFIYFLSQSIALDPSAMAPPQLYHPLDGFLVKGHSVRRASNMASCGTLDVPFGYQCSTLVAGKQCQGRAHTV